MLHFKWGRRCGAVFKSNSPLKTDSHCPVSLYLSRAAYRRGDKGCAGTGSRVTKAPPLPAGDNPELVLQGHHWNQGSVRKSICKYPCTRKGKNLAAPASGSEQKVLAPNELCQFATSWTQAPETKPWSPLSGSLSTASCERVTAQGSYKATAWGRGYHWFCDNKWKRMNFIVKWKQSKNFRTRNTLKYYCKETEIFHFSPPHYMEQPSSPIPSNSLHPWLL